MNEELITREERAYDNLIERYYALKGDLADEQAVSAELRAELKTLRAENERNLVAWRTSESGYEQMKKWRDEAQVQLAALRAELAEAHKPLSTAALVRLLSEREGVERVDVRPEHEVQILVRDGETILHDSVTDGPSIVMRIID